MAANSTLFTCSGETLLASTGSSTATVAAFDAKAESVTVVRLAAVIWSSGGESRSAASWAPSQCERPLASIAAAIEKPPPSSTSVSHWTKRSEAGASAGRPLHAPEHQHEAREHRDARPRPARWRSPSRPRARSASVSGLPRIQSVTAARNTHAHHALAALHRAEPRALARERGAADLGARRIARGRHARARARPPAGTAPRRGCPPP